MFRWRPDVDARYRRRPDVRWKKLDGAAAVLDESEGQLVHFSDVGGRIWEELDGRRTVGELAELLSREFEASLPTLRRDVDGFLARLLEMELVEKVAA